jgi:hypothetical protein
MYETYNPAWLLKVSAAEWAALLSIATRFAFDRLRTRAIAVLTPSSHSMDDLLDPVEAAVLAAKHDVPQWLEPSYVLLCMRDEPLDEAEGERLGLATTVRLARARERFWREQARSGVPEGRLEEDMWLRAGLPLRWGMRTNCPRRAAATRIVRDVFWPESIGTAQAS